MSLSKEEVVVALDGTVSLGAADATPPEDLDSLDAGEFADLGYQSSDGVTFTVTPNVQDIEAWQSATPIRKLVTARTLTLAFSALQWNVNTFAAAYGGGAWTEVDAPSPPDPGLYRYDPPANEDALVDYVGVLDFLDGDKQYRLVVKQGNITESVETNLARGGAAVLPITIEAITPDEDDRSWYLLSNDPAVQPDPASS